MTPDSRAQPKAWPGADHDAEKHAQSAHLGHWTGFEDGVDHR